MAESAQQRVLEWLSADGRDPAECSQAEYQQFAWHTVPYRGDGPSAEVAEACAQLLEQSGRPRAAAAMRRHNPDVLAAWERSDSAGFRAFVKANDATGITPPDTPQLAWAAVFGTVEAEVLDGAERLLEDAVEDGRLVPGGRRWRNVQRELLERWLTAPVSAHGGAVPVDAVRAERRDRWLESGTAVRGELLRRALGVIEPPPERPEPLQALLDVAARNIALTEAQRVPPGDHPGDRRPPRLDRPRHHCPQRAPRPGVRHAPAAGRRRRAADPPRADAAPEPGGARGAGQPGRPRRGGRPSVVRHGGVPDRGRGGRGGCAAGGAGSGHADRRDRQIRDRPGMAPHDGSPPDPEELRDAVHEWIHRGLVLGWLAVSDDLDYELTGTGRRAAIAGLLRCAHAPRSRP